MLSLRERRSFYRAFLLTLCESLAKEGGGGGGGGVVSLSANGELARVAALLAGALKDCGTAGYDSSTLEMFHAELVSVLDFLASPPSGCSPAGLLAMLGEEGGPSEYATWFLRALTACQLKKDRERFAMYLPDNYFGDLDGFVEKEVLPMGREVEQVQIIALVEYFGVRVSIEYLDGHSEKVSCHELGSDESVTILKLLYRPGHYDALY